jgi:hypothetical protein
MGVPTAFRSTGRSAKGGVLSVSCDVTYSATLRAPVSGVYQLVAIKAGRPGRHLDTARARGAQLSGGHVPALGVTFCPDCPAQG